MDLNQKTETQVSKILSQPNFPDLKHDEAILVLNKEERRKKKFKKLFKQVAKATHPDKHEGDHVRF